MKSWWEKEGKREDLSKIRRDSDRIVCYRRRDGYKKRNWDWERAWNKGNKRVPHWEWEKEIVRWAHREWFGERESKHCESDIVRMWKKILRERERERIARDSKRERRTDGQAENERDRKLEREREREEQVKARVRTWLFIVFMEIWIAERSKWVFMKLLWDESNGDKPTQWFSTAEKKSIAKKTCDFFANLLEKTTKPIS